MFRITKTIPEISNIEISKIEEVIPSLSTLVNIPVIETAEQAIDVAILASHKELARGELISRVENIKVTDAGWEITLVAIGD